MVALEGDTYVTYYDHGRLIPRWHCAWVREWCSGLVLVEKHLETQQRAIDAGNQHRLTIGTWNYGNGYASLIDRIAERNINAQCKPAHGNAAMHHEPLT